MVDENEIREIESKLEFREDGKVVAQVGLLFTVYFRNGDDANVRAAVAACFDRYRAIAGDELRWGVRVAPPRRSGRFRSIRRNAGPTLTEWLCSLDAVEEWAFQYRGGDDAESASAFSVEAFCPQDYGKDKFSYFNATFPMLFFATRAEKFQDLALEFCRLIQPDQGYGGLGILESPFPRIQAKHESLVYQLAQRFPGLEVDYPVTHGIWLRQENGIKGGNWLTVLGERWVQKLGGADRLRGELTEEFIVSEYPSGLFIQAGPRPQMGDSEKGQIPHQYAALAAVLKPVRISRTRMFHHPGEMRFDEAASIAWLARFDSAPNLNQGE